MFKMYTCINCGTQVDELYRRYSPTVLKILECEKCGEFADKYVEYDPVIVLVDLVLLDKPAYRHLLYNSDFAAYWKLVIVLILGESFRQWSAKRQQYDEPGELFAFKGERFFYFELWHTGLALSSFVFAILFLTEMRWMFFGCRPAKYRQIDLVKALIVGGCAKLLGLIGIVWEHDEPELHNLLILGYVVLCLLTAYSVVCESGRAGSLIGLAGGLLAHNCTYRVIQDFYSMTANTTLLQSQSE